MLRKILYVLLFLLIVATACFARYQYVNSDYYNKKVIQDIFKEKYTVSFKYLNKSKDVSTGRKIYYYSCEDIEAIIVRGSAGYVYDSPIPLIPYIYYKTYNQDFTQKLVTYLVDKKCDGTVDVTGMNMEDATKLVKDLMIEIDKEIAQYFKSDPFYMGIDLHVIRGGKSKELHFSHATEYSIRGELQEIIHE